MVTEIDRDRTQISAKDAKGKYTTVHTLQHSFAMHMLGNGTDLRFIQSLPEHSSSQATEINAHGTSKAGSGIKSPLRRLDFWGVRCRIVYENGSGAHFGGRGNENSDLA